MSLSCCYVSRLPLAGEVADDFEMKLHDPMQLALEDAFLDVFSVMIRGGRRSGGLFFAQPFRPGVRPAWPLAMGQTMLRMTL
jgi:hypothetical protein